MNFTTDPHPVPDEREQLFRQTRRAAREECVSGSCSIYPIIDLCALDAVETYQDSRIKTFVPLLAVRQVRDCIHADACPDIQNRHIR